MSVSTSNEEFFNYLASANDRVLAFIKQSNSRTFHKPDYLAESVLSYILRPAKRLRPAVLLMACGSVGGQAREEIAVPAAAAIELFHTWTLVHDDLIDNDSLRRGEPTVHEAITHMSKKKFQLDENLSKEYGRDIAILAGDSQHGWSIASFAEPTLYQHVDPIVILEIIHYLQTYVLGNLVHGEILDVQYGMTQGLDLDIDEERIVHMLWLKTGVLYEFAGLAGALIGKNTADFNDNQVEALSKFTGNCGTAFQLQDDILGILGDEKSLGKPVGSDIREGKKTVIVYESLKNANESQKETILSILGNKRASLADIEKVTKLFQELGGIDRTKMLAKAYVEKALEKLVVIDDSKYKLLLTYWADYMINREF